MTVSAAAASAGNWRRNDERAFNATVVLAAANLDISALAVEKDYWVCEALRAIETAFPQRAVFKGGTSLEKMGIVQRFSEDLDVMVVGDIGRSSAAPSLLKAMFKAAADVTGGTFTNVISGGKKETYWRKGDLEFPAFNSVDRDTALADPNSILLELGQSTGFNPFVDREVTSLLSRALSDRIDTTSFDDLRPFSMQMLHPGRTLIEKLLRVNTFATMSDNRRKPEYWTRIGRQYYDLWALLDQPQVLEFLGDRDEVNAIAKNCIEESIRFGGDEPIPTGGFARSPAFDPVGKLTPRLRREHELTMIELYYGPVPGPSFDEVLVRVHDHGDLLAISSDG